VAKLRNSAPVYQVNLGCPFLPHVFHKRAVASEWFVLLVVSDGRVGGGDDCVTESLSWVCAPLCLTGLCW